MEDENNAKSTVFYNHNNNIKVTAEIKKQESATIQATKMEIKWMREMK